MLNGMRYVMLGLFSLVLAGSLIVSGCSRYANEEQITALDESEAAATESEEKVAELEKEKADLQAKLAEKQEELKKTQEEHERLKGVVDEQE